MIVDLCGDRSTLFATFCKARNQGEGILEGHRSTISRGGHEGVSGIAALHDPAAFRHPLGVGIPKPQLPVRRLVSGGGLDHVVDNGIPPLNVLKSTARVDDTGPALYGCAVVFVGEAPAELGRRHAYEEVGAGAYVQGRPFSLVLEEFRDPGIAKRDFSAVARPVQGEARADGRLVLAAEEAQRSRSDAVRRHNDIRCHAAPVREVDTAMRWGLEEIHDGLTRLDGNARFPRIVEQQFIKLPPAHRDRWQSVGAQLHSEELVAVVFEVGGYGHALEPLHEARPFRWSVQPWRLNEEYLACA